MFGYIGLAVLILKAILLISVIILIWIMIKKLQLGGKMKEKAIRKYVVRQNKDQLNCDDCAYMSNVVIKVNKNKIAFQKCDYKGDNDDLIYTDMSRQKSKCYWNNVIPHKIGEITPSKEARKQQRLNFPSEIVD